MNEGLVGVKIGDKWGFINKKAEIIISAQFEKVKDFRKGLAGVKIDGKWGLINKKGDIVVEPKFYSLLRDHEVVAVVQTNQGYFGDSWWAYIDKDGKLILGGGRDRFDYAARFRDGIAKVEVGGKFGYIDKEGNYIWEPTY